MRTPSRILLSALACAALLIDPRPAHPQGQQPAKLTTVKLAEDLYVIENPYIPGNTTVLITNEGVLLVDAKFAADAGNILAEVRKLTPQPVKYVINSHHHGDHSGGNPAMRQAGAVIVSSEAARARMVAARQAGEASITVAERGQIHLGGVSVDLLQLGRGHTDGDLLVYFPAQRVLVAGDLFTNDPAAPALVDYMSGGSALEWLKTLARALELDFDRVVPGHGPVTDKAGLAGFRDGWQRFTTRLHDMLAAGRERAEVEKVLREEYGFQQFQLMMSMQGLMGELK